MELNSDFLDMIAALHEEGADFLIVGAYAMAAHGVPRATGDLDIWVRPEAQNAARVWRALAQFGAPLEATGLSQEDLARPDMVYQVGQPPRRIDILTSISGVSFEDAWPHRVIVPLGDLKVVCLGRDDLVANKGAAAREKDLADLEILKKGAPGSKR